MFIKTKRKTLLIALIALFTALNVVVNALDIQIPPYSISFVVAINFIAGITVGPFVALASGALGDLLGCFIKGYAPNIFILLGSSLWGFVMGMIYKLKFDKTWLKIIFASLITYVLCSLLLNSYGMYTYTSKGIPFLSYMLVRAPVQLLNLLANAVITYLIITALELKKNTDLLKKQIDKSNHND